MLEIVTVGNFIKPVRSTLYNSAQPEAATREKPEKGRRGHNDCKRYRRGSARRISWRPVCVLWWALHSRPWCCICILEIRLRAEYDNDSPSRLMKMHLFLIWNSDSSLPWLTNRIRCWWQGSWIILFKIKLACPKSLKADSMFWQHYIYITAAGNIERGHIKLHGEMMW